MKKLTSPRYMMRFHLAMTAIWLLALIPTLLWWKESILWVPTMSLYANVVGHFSAWQAAKAEKSNEKGGDKE